jgi:valyl-tRNA synthetase
VPFLTETLWSRLNELAPERGIAQPVPGSELLVHARWPDADPAWSKPAVEAQLAAMQQWCVAIRETRARYQVPPRERLAARFQAEGEAAHALRATAGLLAHMAGLASVEIDGSAQRTPDSATVVHGAGKAFLLGVVDLEKERGKLRQQAEKLGGQVEALERKLGNEGFVAKAPPAVVEKERGSLAALRAQLAGVEQSLRELGS